MKILTEGVLFFASAKGLYNEYKDKKFDYDFPNGISNLLDRQSIIALTTPDGDDIVIEFVDVHTKIETDVDAEIEQVITLLSDDKLLILSHADFTQICDGNGDSENYRWPIDRIEGIEAGSYLVNIKVKDTGKEFDKYEAYFRLLVSMKKIENSKISNKVLEINGNKK